MQPARVKRSVPSEPQRSRATPEPTAEVPRGSPTAGPARLVALRAAAQAAAARRPGGPLLILTHRSPDPDALGACVGAEALVRDGFGLPVQVATRGRIHRAENVAMVRELRLDFDAYAGADLSGACGAVLVDSQPSFGHTSVPEGLPVVGVIDHHIPPEGGSSATGVGHLDVRTDVGATSSMVYEYLRDAGVPLDARTATALFCGVRFDTADLSAHCTPLDEEAYFETFRRADRGMLARIQRPRLPQDYYCELSRSLRSVRRYGPAVVALLGRVKNPESVAEMADLFLRMEGCKWSFVGGAFEGQYHVSLRTQVGGPEAYSILAQLLVDGGSFGGHGRVAGGQIPVDGTDFLGIRRIERRLHKRVIERVDPHGELDLDSRLGRSLS
jgi:nanoRNase/pAp phosphatase (c-di-AMP/oligoRNAs hydrolase)